MIIERTGRRFTVASRLEFFIWRVRTFLISRLGTDGSNNARLLQICDIGLGRVGIVSWSADIVDVEVCLRKRPFDVIITGIVGIHAGSVSSSNSVTGLETGKAGFCVCVSECGMLSSRDERLVGVVEGKAIIQYQQLDLTYGILITYST